MEKSEKRWGSCDMLLSGVKIVVVSDAVNVCCCCFFSQSSLRLDMLGLVSSTKTCVFQVVPMYACMHFVYPFCTPGSRKKNSERKLSHLEDVLSITWKMFGFWKIYVFIVFHILQL